VAECDAEFIAPQATVVSHGDLHLRHLLLYVSASRALNMSSVAITTLEPGTV
jgi:hypothetical protein